MMPTNFHFKTVAIHPKFWPVRAPSYIAIIANTNYSTPAFLKAQNNENKWNIIVYNVLNQLQYSTYSFKT